MLLRYCEEGVLLKTLMEQFAHNTLAVASVAKQLWAENVAAAVSGGHVIFCAVMEKKAVLSRDGDGECGSVVLCRENCFGGTILLY